MTSPALPAYDDLPALGDLGVRHSWGLLPENLGTLALIGPEQVQRAVRTVVDGESYALSEPMSTFPTPMFGRDGLRHEIVEVGRNELEDVFDRWNPQAYSQIDGLAHVRAREHGFYGGHTDTGVARDRLGMHHWATRGIVGRGVLIDVERTRRGCGTDEGPGSGSAITHEELRHVAAEQGVTIEPGDIVLVRTGWLECYRQAPDSFPTTAWNGLHAGEQTARFLWDSGIAMVGADNPAVECAPGSREAGSLHRRLLPSLGMSLLELLRLDELAAALAARGRWEFLFTAAPVPVEGAVSSPANALAVL